MIVLAILILAPLLTSAIEYRPGEREAEYLFNHGIGKPWIGGNPPYSPYWSWPGRYYSAWPYAYSPIRGYPYADHSFSFSSESADGLQFRHGQGSYPVYGHYSSGRLPGRFSSLQRSSGRLQMRA